MEIQNTAISVTFAESEKMIFETLKKLVAEQFSVSEDSVTMDTAFVDDLNADSLDIVEFTMQLEEKLDIPETDEEELAKLTTVGDVVNYIEKLTDED